MIVVVLLIVSLVSAHASGKKESSFKEIDALILERDFNQALLLLERYIKNNPQDFDNAQQRIKMIIDKRVGYNQVATDLIDTIIKEPTNDKKKLEMISALESMEKNPSASAQAFITQTKIAAQFTYFRAKFEELMVNGSRLVTEGKYTEAARIFEQGYVLYQEDFFQQGYDAAFVKSVADELATIKSILPLYENIQSKLINSVAVFTAAVKNNKLDDAYNLFTKVVEQMNEFVILRNTVANSGWKFQQGYANLLKQNPNLTEASFLPFAYRFTLGRSSDAHSGILGAMDTQWNSLMDTMKTQSAQSLASLWRNSSDLIDAKGFLVLPATHLESRVVLNDTIRLSRLAGMVNEFDRLPEVSAGETNQNPDSSFNAYIGAYDILSQNVLQLIDLAKAFADLKTSMDNFAPGTDSAADILNSNKRVQTFYLNGCTSYLSLKQQSEKIKLDSDVFYGQLSADSKKNAASATKASSYLDVNFVYNKTISYAEAIGSSSAEGAVANWLAVGAYFSEGADTIAMQYNSYYERAKTLFAGVQDPQTNLILYYPAESIVDIKGTLRDLPRMQGLLNEKLVLLDTASADVKPVAEHIAAIKKIKDAIAKLDIVKTQGNELILSAEQRVLQAERARQEAELRYNQAVQALRREDFQTARDAIQKSQEKYSQSLSLQESADLRKTIDRKLISLGIDINRAENEVVVKDVRRLKSLAKEAYYAGLFDKSEQLLLQAKTRWAVTNVDEDAEVTLWLSLVGTALSMKTGRVISPTAPLYPEMSQILSIANQLYDKGTAFMAAGKKTEALEVFAQAKQKLKELQLVYPINQEASLLTLKIDQLIDPVAFKKMFAQKFTSAKTDYKNPEKQQYAYTDLLDLYAIDPAYPGLKDFIYQVEIYLGIRIPPPDPKVLAQSAALTKEAQKAVNSTSEVVVRTALAQLDQAIKLNPNNEEAIVLKDRLQTKSGGAAVAVLSSESEALYQKAVLELQSNNIITAASLVAQLMQKPENKKSSKVLDLQKRIQVLSGQTN